MGTRTDYIFHQPAEDIIEEEVDSPLSEEEKQEYGYVQYEDDSSDSNADDTPRSTKSTPKSTDFDIRDIRVEFLRRETTPLLQGTILSKLPYSPRPPSHSPRRRSISTTSSSSDVPIQPYYEERGEISGHFEPDRLSSDFVAKPPSVMSSRRSSHVTFRNSSSNDSGVSSQATSTRTPTSSDGYNDSQDDTFVDMTDDAYHEYLYALEKYAAASRASSQSLHRGRGKKVRLKSAKRTRSTPDFSHQESDISLPTYDSSLDSLENVSDNLDNLCSPSPDRRSSIASTSTVVVKPPQGRIMTRQRFHRSYFVRARYPPNLHTDKFAKQKQAYKPPASLCPPSRYGKEAKILKKRPPSKKSKQWPEPPRYPPKARHASIECDILKLVETLDLGIQCNAEMQETSVQCSATMTDSATQYPKIRRKNMSIQTVDKKFSDACVQNSVETRNRMVETSQRILYLPMVNQVNAKTQCEPTMKSCEVQADVEEVMGVSSGKGRVLTRQDTIDRIKEQNRRSSITIGCEDSEGQPNKSAVQADSESDTHLKKSGKSQTKLVPQDSVGEEKKKAQAAASWDSPGDHLSRTSSRSSICSKHSNTSNSGRAEERSRSESEHSNAYEEDFHSVNSDSGNEGVPESCE